MEVIKLVGIKIPSLNDKYGHNPRSGKFFTVPEYKKFKSLLQQICKKQMLPPPYRVQINVETYKDIDNIEKVVLDSLQGNCIDNDKNVHEKFTKKTPKKKGSLDNLRVWVETITPRT